MHPSVLIFNKNDMLIVKPSSKYNENDFVVIIEKDMIKITKYNNNKHIIGKVIASIRKY